MEQPVRTIAASLLLVMLLYGQPYAAGRPALVPMERESTFDTLPMGDESPKKEAPEQERVRMQKEDITGAALSKKDPLVIITEPRKGEVAMSCQKVAGRIGGGIARAFLRINDDNQVVTVADGSFEAYVSLRPGINSITVLAWDLDGNLGKDSIKVIYSPLTDAPKVEIVAPVDWASYDITEDRVITVEARTDDASITEGWLSVNNMPRKVGFEHGAVRQELTLLPGLNELYFEVVDKQGRAGRSETVRVDTFDARPKDLVAALFWDSPTADLDLHVWDSFGHHTFNEAKGPFVSDAAIPCAMLDMDRKGGYGPEVFSLESAEPEVYSFYAKYNPGVKDTEAVAYLRVLLYGDEPSRRIMRTFGPRRMDEYNPAWEPAIVKMPEGVFFQEKDTDLAKTLRMDSKAVRRLTFVLEEENPAFRLLAISAMGQIKSEEALPPLMKALDSTDPEVRRAAAGALWNIKSLASVDRLIKALSDQDAEVRRACAGALGNIGDKKAVFSLTGLLAEEGDPQVRVEAIRAIGRIGDARAIDSLLSQAKDSNPRIRVETMRALGGVEDAKTEKTLDRALQEDKVDGVRELAAWALGRQGTKESLKPLMDTLRFDSSEWVRVQCALSLGLIKDVDAKEELANAVAHDQSPKVRFCASKALEAMMGPAVKGCEPQVGQESGQPPVDSQGIPFPAMDEDLVIY